MSGFILVEDRVLGTAASSVVFNTGLTDSTRFRVTAYIVKDATPGAPQMRLNGDTGSNYVRARMNANGATVGAVRATSDTLFTHARAIAANSTMVFEVSIEKPLASLPARALASNATITSNGVEYEAHASEWNNTADLISSITLFASAGNFDAGTRIVLEGAPGTAPVTDSAARLVVDGAIEDDDYSSAAPWSEEYSSQSLGPIDISAIAVADLNASDFGAAISADVPEDNTAEVDAVAIRLTYDVAVDVDITDPVDEGTLDAPNATITWDAEVGGSPVTQNDYRVRLYRLPAMTLVYDSGTVASATQEHTIGSGTPVVPWSSPMNGQSIRIRVDVTEDGTADPDGVGDPISGTAEIDVTTDWTPLTAITGFTATPVVSDEGGS